MKFILSMPGMAENASQSIENPLGGLPQDPRLLVPSTSSARWPFSVLAPVKFRAGFAPVFATMLRCLYHVASEASMNHQYVIFLDLLQCLGNVVAMWRQPSVATTLPAKVRLL